MDAKVRYFASDFLSAVIEAFLWLAATSVTAGSLL